MQRARSGADRSSAGGRLRRALPAAALGVALCASPASAQLAAGLHAFSIEFDGLTRSYDLYVPASYSGAPAPLVLDFHSFSSTKDSERIVSGFNRSADAEGYLVAYPQGYGIPLSWNTPVCCGPAQEAGLDDVGLAVAIVAAIAAATPIDATRVYATGHSNGGALAHLLACRAADTFAAVASVSYPLPVTPPGACQPSRGIPVIHFHGFSDELIPFASTNALAPYTAPGSLAAWAGINRCTSPPTVFFQRGQSFCGVVSGCRDGAVAVLCGIPGSHSLYSNPERFPIADVAWAILSRFSKPE